MKREMSREVIGSFVLAFLFLSVNALGQEKQYPLRPVNLHIGSAPGGAMGSTGTIIAEGMKKYLKQPVIVSYKPGAGQGVAADFIKNSPPDGYNLLCTELEALAVKLIAESGKLSFRYEDFELIGAGPYFTALLATNVESPWKTVEDLIAGAQKSPGKVSLGNTGFGMGNHLRALLLCTKSGINLNHIPYNGGGPLITALLGKHVDVGISNVTSLGPHVKEGGGLRGLLVFHRDRSSEVPHIPTSSEKGIGPTEVAYLGLLAPKGLPEKVRSALVEAFRQSLEDPETSSALKKLGGLKVNYLSPSATNRQMEEYHKIYGEAWRTISTK
jgi:tripartite-type tricarboxylate transporter receptor subunit TctC